MPNPSSLSRRGLVAAAALAAVAPRAEARKRRRKPKPAPAPLAFAAVVAQGVSNIVDGGDRRFRFHYQSRMQHPASGLVQSLNDASVDAAIAVPPEQARQRIVADARAKARAFLLDGGHDVPADRIAVTLV